jgi:16S rRNA G966 N2-methylase RsmD
MKGIERFDIVFIDAPYAAKLTGDALARLCEHDLLNDGATVVCESDDEKTFENDQLSVIKQTRYGKTYITLYKKVDDALDLALN